MIKHICKLVWNRKRVNFLITLDIFISFLVVFAVIALAVYCANNYRQPLGFDYHNVWHMKINRVGLSGQAEKEARPTQLETMKRILAAVREFGKVESVAGALTVPYMNGDQTSCDKKNERLICYWSNAVTDDYKEVLKIKMVRGRWFDMKDDGASYKPVVISQRLAADFFGDEDPIGKRLNEPSPGDKEYVEKRVIGVIDDFRKNGEFAELKGYAFFRNALKMPNDRPPDSLAIRVHPGTTAAFEEKLLKRLQAEAKDWTFRVKPIDQMREENLRETMVPMIAFGLVAGFLMIMVALGLTGVLWQTVTQRIKEIGLRRAKGATAQKIYKQILGELMIITTTALFVGVLVVVQFPLLDVWGFADDPFLKAVINVQFPLLDVWGFATTKVYMISIFISLALIYLLTIICGLYPSRLATRVQPAEALHYE